MIRVVPVHPHAETFGLFGDDVREPVHPLFAKLHEVTDSVRFDIQLGLETQLFFDLDFDPQSLAVEAVLEPLFVALHIAESQEQVFITPAPGVVDAHRVVCGDGAVYERPAFVRVFVALSVLARNIILVPPREHVFFQLWEVLP